MGKRKGNPVSGWIILDKPYGVTSTQAVGACKRIFNARKAGHAGTLDPLATGILPIALGEATKTVSHIVDGEKGYLFTITWGAETSTDDAEGEVIETSDERPSLADVEAALPAFIGDIEQVPPKFSAIKVNGERAYNLARDGEDVALRARTVTVDDLSIKLPAPDEGQPSKDEKVATTTLEATCGKGTYIRAIARDLGRMLGCFGHVTSLRRTRVGPFHESASISLEKLQEISHIPARREEVFEFLHPVETALDDIPALDLGSQDASRLKRGQSVLLIGRDAPILTGSVYATSRGQLIAIGEVRQGELHPTRVFNF